MMPGMDGFEVCERIKSNPNLMHIPVVMVTALSDTSDRVRGLDAGADDFLTKPVNDIALFVRARSLIHLKIMMDECVCRRQLLAALAWPMAKRLRSKLLAAKFWLSRIGKFMPETSIRLWKATTM